MEIMVGTKTFVLKKISHGRAAVAMGLLDLYSMTASRDGKTAAQIKALEKSADVMKQNMELIPKTIDCIWDIFIKDEDKQVISKEDLWDIVTLEYTIEFVSAIAGSFEKKSLDSTKKG